MSKRRYFLPYELDAFNSAPTIGVACGASAASVVYGNMLMWQHVWKTKSDLVTTAHVKAFFGVNACEALVLFGHLEASEQGWRVKGAAEWLRVMTAQSRAGKAHAKNLIPGGPAALGSPSAPPSASALFGAQAEAKPIGSPSALPATIDHRPAKDKSIVEHARPGPVERVFAKYQAAAASPRSKLDQKRRRLIEARLEDFAEDDLIRSLEGYARSPHHHGENDRHQKYLSLELWFRDAGHVEAGMSMATAPPLLSAPITTLQNTPTPYPLEFR